MPTNKNASYRYRIIDLCLRNTGRKWTLENLMDEISIRLEEDFGKGTGISKRTVQADISIMRSIRPRGFDAPIVCKDGYYSYSDPDYSIENNPLNEQDLRTLTEATELLKQFKNIPVLSELQEMVIKLEGIIPPDDKPERKWIEFEKNENLRGLKFIDPIYKAVRNNKVLTVEYQPFTETTSRPMILHPYLLKEYRNRWFLIGYNDELQKMSHLALDRIESLSPSGKRFVRVKGFSESLYFSDVLGITIPEGSEPETIELEIAPARAPYIKTKPLHPSQTILLENENGLLIHLNLIINKELISELLGFGKDVKALKPVSLKALIKENLSRALENYQS